jgi:hypothetical protein
MHHPKPDALHTTHCCCFIPLCPLQFELLTNAGCRGAAASININGVSSTSQVYQVNTDPTTGQK